MEDEDYPWFQKEVLKLMLRILKAQKKLGLNLDEVIKNMEEMVN